MTMDIAAPDLVLGIAGAGNMGSSVARLAALAGIRTLLYDLQPGAAAQARSAIAAAIDGLAGNGRLAPDAAAAALARIEVVTHLGDLAPSNILIEAIVENLDAKRQLFAALEDIVAPEAILASNSASLSVSAIAAACGNPGRVAGCHFFSPVDRIRAVEVVDGLLTQGWVGESLAALVRRLGHTPVRVRDAPGLIVDHTAHALLSESLFLLQEGVAAPADIDRVLRDGAGFPIGPFEMLDAVGLDRMQPAMDAIYHRFYQEPRLRPSPLAALRLTARLLGSRSGRGFYRHGPDGAEDIAEPPPPAARPARVWVGSADPAWRARVIQLVKQLGGHIDGNRRPATDALCVVTPLGLDTTGCCVSESLDAGRTVGLDLLLDGPRRRTLMTTPVTTQAMRAAAHGLFAADGTPVTVIRDSPGFIVQRVLAQVVNAACDMAQQRIAAPADIDRAATLALGYPLGPLAWGDRLGPRRLLTVMDALRQFYGDPRYRASPWLKRRALLGISLLTEEN